MNYPGNNNPQWSFNGIPNNVQSVAPSYQTFISNQRGEHSRQEHPNPSQHHGSGNFVVDYAGSNLSDDDYAITDDEADRYGGPAKEGGGQSVAYWPDLRPFLIDDDAIKSLQLECPICTNASENMRVLSCGHILCRECINRLLQNRDGVPGNPRGRTRECPYCRVQLGKKRGCAPNCPQEKSWTVGIRVPSSMTELIQFPLTMAEGGGKPLACTGCRDHRVKSALNLLCRELLNDPRAHLTTFSQGQTYEQALGNVSTTFTRVPELQNICDAVMDRLYSPEFCAKYTGMLAPSTRQQGAAEFPKRP